MSDNMETNLLSDCVGAALTYIKPRFYQWSPKEDITAYELALCLPLFSSQLFIHDMEPFINGLPPESRRHWIEVE